MRTVIAIVLGLVALVITPGLLFYFDSTPKLAVILLGSSALLLFHRRNIENLRRLLSTAAGRWFTIAIAAEWLSLACSTALSANVALAVFGSTWRRFGLLSYTAILVFVLIVAAWIAADRENILVFLRSIAASGAVGSVYGIAQYFGFDPLLPAKSYLAGEGPFTIVRPPGTMGHANYFAAWLVVVIFCAACLIRIEDSVLARRVAGAVVALGLVAVVLSGTRGALLGTFAGFVYFFARLRPKVTGRSAIAASAVVLIAGAFAISTAGNYLRARVRWSLDDLRGGARLLLWRDSLRLAGKHPALGFGPEAFVTEFPHVESLDLARAYPDFYHESPHNIFLDALVQQGIAGVSVLMGLCALGLYTAHRNQSPVAIPLGACVVAAIVTEQFTVFLPSTALYFFAILALLAGLPDSESRQAARLHRYLFLPAGLLAAVLTLFAIRLIIADHALASANARIEAADVTGAARSYQAARAWQWPGHASDLFYSRSMASLSTRLPPGPLRAMAWDQALASAYRATVTADDPQNASYNLAILLSASNDWTGVENALRSAAAAAPAWFKPHLALARVLELSGRHAEALVEAADALEKDGGKDPEVVESWRRINQPIRKP